VVVADADDVEGPAVVGFVTGVMVTPVTSPLMVAFSLLLVVPLAARVALSLAVAAARASVDKGLGDFLGWMSKAVRVVGESQYVNSTLSLIPFASRAFSVMVASSAATASLAADFAAAVAAEASSKDWTSATAWVAVNVCPATEKTVFVQYFGMLVMSAWYCVWVSSFALDAMLHLDGGTRRPAAAGPDAELVSVLQWLPLANRPLCVPVRVDFVPPRVDSFGLGLSEPLRHLDDADLRG
jgi:hypothetical protein